MAEIGQTSLQLYSAANLLRSVTRLPGQRTVNLEETRRNLLSDLAYRSRERESTRMLIQGQSDLNATRTLQRSLTQLDRYRNTSISQENDNSDGKTLSFGTNRLGRNELSTNAINSILRNRIFPQQERQSSPLAAPGFALNRFQLNTDSGGVGDGNALRQRIPAAFRSVNVPSRILTGSNSGVTPQIRTGTFVTRSYLPSADSRNNILTQRVNRPERNNPFAIDITA
ncbi:hypothetical protein ACFL4Q_00380 [candidate division KSB1 bacterium]